MILVYIWVLCEKLWKSYLMEIKILWIGEEFESFLFMWCGDFKLINYFEISYKIVEIFRILVVVKENCFVNIFFLFLDFLIK